MSARTISPILCQHEQSIISLQEKLCPFCKAATRTSTYADTIPFYNVSIPGRLWLVSSCPNCGLCGTDVVSVFFSHPEVMNFALQHIRMVAEPIQWLEYAGRQTLCVRLSDLTSGRQLTILADPELLEIITVYKK